MSDVLQPTMSVPHIARSNGAYGEYAMQVVYSVYEYVKNFIAHNLTWLKETGGVKTLLIKFPDAIISISQRIGPATGFSGKVINIVTETLIPLQKLGACASPLVGFAEVGSKFSAMFSAPATRVNYVVKDANGKAYKAQFPLNYLDQKLNQAQNIADWTLSFTYIWKLNHTDGDKFPLAPIATWSARYMSIKGLYSEGRFLYEIYARKPMQRKSYDDVVQKKIVARDVTVAWEEVAGSFWKISLSIACLCLDRFKTLASKDQSPWLETAIFCAGLAPTFITPVAMRYWPKMVTEPLYAAASA